MTIPRLLEMETYWGSHPPIHQMLSAFFGIEGKESEATVAVEDAMGAFLRDFSQAGGVVTGDLGDVSV